MQTADFSFRYESSKTASLVADAIRQELDEIGSDRATATLDRKGKRLDITINAEDLIALRAGMNTWTTLVEVAERTIDAATNRTGTAGSR